MKYLGTLPIALAALLVALPVIAVEMLDDSAMGGVHIESGNVLNIVGPTAAGSDEPPIQQTAGAQSSLAMALSLRNADTNRPENNPVPSEQNILSLVFPQLTRDVPLRRRVPSPAGSGSTSFVIQPGERRVTSQVEMVDGQQALRQSVDVRIEQLEWDNVHFPSRVVYEDGNTTIMRGFNVRGRGMIREANGN